MSDNPFEAPSTTEPRLAAPGTRTLTRVHVLQAGIVLGALYALLGLIFVPIFMIASVGDPDAAGLGVVFALLIPIMYGIGGFIGGVIVAAIYNLLAGVVGGLRFDFE